jgi:hypothetical protein
MRMVKRSLNLGVLFLALVLGQQAFGAWHSLSGASRAQGEPAHFEVLRSDASGTWVRVSLEGFNTEALAINGSSFVSIQPEGLGVTDEAGSPELPRLNRNLLVPASSRPTLEVLEIQDQSFQLGPVAPSKGVIYRNQDPSSIPYTFSDAYARNAFFPAEVAALSEPFTLRDARGVNLSVRPFRYNPVTGELRVIREITLKISTPSGRSFRMFTHSGLLDGAFLGLYRESFANFGSLAPSRDVQHLITDTGKLLIITHKNFEAGLESFVQWKKQRGLQVQVANLDKTGSTAQQIKSYIADRYHQDKISSVILVGDSEFVPFFPGTAGNVKGNEADPLYGTIDGNDAYPELMVSRFSVKDANGLATIVNKIIQYEKEPEAGGDWYSRASGVASNEGDPTDWQRAEELRAMLEAWHYKQVDKLYDPGVKKADLTNALNEGRGFINYIGHGSVTSWGTTGFSNSDIDALSNGRRLPFIVSVACVVGHFASYGESFAERWLLAGSPTQPKGAVAIYASSTNQSWVPPTVGQKETTRLLTSGKMDTIGMLFVHGGIAVLEDASSTADQTFQSWHIFGDATMQVRTQPPTAIEASLPEALKAAGALEVNAGAPGITVALTQGGELLGAAVSGEDGRASFSVDPALAKAGTATLTLTGSNRIPLIREVELQP